MISEQTNPDQSDLALEAAKTAAPRPFDQSVQPRERRSPAVSAAASGPRHRV